MYCTLEFQMVYHAMKHPFYIIHMYAYLHTQHTNPKDTCTYVAYAWALKLRQRNPF